MNYHKGVSEGNNFVNRRILVVIGSLILGVGLLFIGLKVLGRVNAFKTETQNCDKNCLPQGPIHTPPQPEPLINHDTKLADLLGEETQDLTRISLLVEKANARLTLYRDRQPIKSYPIVLGTSPSGDKRREGDRKTPEGVFRIHKKYPHPTWSKFLWLDYPTADSWRKHRAAKRSGQIEPNATIGSEIGIHGVPPGKDHWIDQGKNWTWGCVALKNKDIDELYPYLQAGTLVEIMP